MLLESVYVLIHVLVCVCVCVCVCWRGGQHGEGIKVWRTRYHENPGLLVIRKILSLQD